MDNTEQMINELFELARTDDNGLTPWEETFIFDMKEKLEKYGAAKLRVSDKQREVLNRMFEKALTNV